MESLQAGKAPIAFQVLHLSQEVHVLGVPQIAVGDQKVLVAVQIHVEKPGRPRPLRGLHTGQLADLGVGSVASVEQQGVAHHLGAAGIAIGHRSLATAGLHLAPAVIAAEHVEDEDVVVAIAVDVRDVDPHRESARGPNGRVWDGPEPSIATVHPHPIR